MYCVPDQAQTQESDSDDGLDALDFPEVPKVSLRPNDRTASAPVMAPPFPTPPHPEIDHELSKNSEVIGHPSQEPSLESGEMMEESAMANKYESHASVGHADDKQFLPFISSPSLSSVTFPARETKPLPPSLSRRRSEANVDMQDVLAAAQAAADSAERAAAAARSAASLAQLRINELTKKNNEEEVSESSCENPFHADIPNQSAAKEKADFDHLIPDGDSTGVINPPESHQVHEFGRGSGTSNLSSMDSLKMNFDSPPPNDHVFEHEPVHHQPQRSTSVDDDPYFSYPNLFTSENNGSGAQSSTDNSRSTQEH